MITDESFVFYAQMPSRLHFFCKNFLHSRFVCARMGGVESTVQLKTPRGITVEEAAAMLRYSTATVRRLIAAHVIVAWKLGGPKGRKYLVDEVTLACCQTSTIARVRTEAAPHADSSPPGGTGALVIYDVRGTIGKEWRPDGCGNKKSSA